MVSVSAISSGWVLWGSLGCSSCTFVFLCLCFFVISLLYLTVFRTLLLFLVIFLYYDYVPFELLSLWFPFHVVTCRCLIDLTKCNVRHKCYFSTARKGLEEDKHTLVLFCRHIWTLYIYHFSFFRFLHT